MSGLNILFIAEEKHIGGAQTVIEELSNSMIFMGHKVSLIQGIIEPKKNFINKLLNSRVKKYRYSFSVESFWRETFSLFKNLWKTLSIATQSTTYDIVFLNYALSASITCLHPSFRRVKKIYLFHGDEPEIMKTLISKPKKHQFLGLIKRAIEAGPHFLRIYLTQKIGLILCNAVIGFSEYTIKVLREELKVDKKKIFRADLGVNYLKFNPHKNKTIAKESIGFSNKTKLILCTSRFEPRKGIDLLISAFNILLNKYSNVYLILTSPLNAYYIGTIYYYELLQLIQKMKLTNRVHLIYNLDRNQLISYYQAADIFVLPSKSLETFGLVTLEALACGIPVITYSKSGAPPEIISKISKELIFKKYDADDLAEKIKLVIEKQSYFKSNFPEKAIKLARNYSWLKCSKFLLSVINR